MPTELCGADEQQPQHDAVAIVDDDDDGDAAVVVDGDDGVNHGQLLLA